jgi:hypothetical protein
MMLADAIEATVRTLDDPTPQRLQGIIDEIFKRRLEEGELDDCPLTLRDLTNIKSAFLNVLVGVYHSRVKYPEVPKRRRRKPPQDTLTPADSESDSERAAASPESDQQTRAIKETDKG